MVKNLSADEIYRFIVDDFEGAWNSLTANPKQGIGRGNFMFVRQAMTLLEFSARLYNSNRKIHQNFSAELAKKGFKVFHATSIALRN